MTLSLFNMYYVKNINKRLPQVLMVLVEGRLGAVDLSLVGFTSSLSLITVLAKLRWIEELSMSILPHMSMTGYYPAFSLFISRI